MSICGYETGHDAHVVNFASEDKPALWVPGNVHDWGVLLLPCDRTNYSRYLECVGWGVPLPANSDPLNQCRRKKGEIPKRTDK